MKMLVSLLTIASVATLGVACATALRTSEARTEPAIALAAGAPASREELIDRWLLALESSDEQALHQLRVTRAEYLDVIVPWTVEPGQPPRQVSEQPREFFWTLLDTKSRDLARRMIAEHGGRKYRPKNLAFSEAPRQYAGYRAHGLVRLEVETEDGSPATVMGPWIAEVGGRYKFIGLDWTD